MCFSCGVQPQYLIISFIVCSDCTDFQAVCASHEEHRERKEQDMEYPKPLMSISELKEMGYSEFYLRRVVHSKYGSRVSVLTKKNGKYLIKTAEFDKLQNRGCFR